MRAIGEKGFGRLAQARACPRSMKERAVSIQCACGEQEKKSEIEIKKYPAYKDLCFKCRVAKRDDDKKAINSAIVAVARRRGLIK